VDGGALKKRLIIAGAPISTYLVPFHYWKDMLKQAGMPSELDEIPMKFKEFSDFWKEAQDRLWQKVPEARNKIYGIG